MGSIPYAVGANGKVGGEGEYRRAERRIGSDSEVMAGEVWCGAQRVGGGCAGAAKKGCWLSLCLCLRAIGNNWPGLRVGQAQFGTEDLECQNIHTLVQTNCQKSLQVYMHVYVFT